MEAPPDAGLFAAKVLCTECKKLFNNAWFLHLHKLRAHPGEEEQQQQQQRRRRSSRRSLACPRDGCEKQFNCRFSLDSHVLGEHEGKKAFSCAVAGCHKSFAMKVNLNT